MMHHLSLAWMCGHVGCWSPKCHRGWGGNVSRWFPNYQWCGCCWSKMIGIWHVVGDNTSRRRCRASVCVVSDVRVKRSCIHTISIIWKFYGSQLWHNYNTLWLIVTRYNYAKFLFVQQRIYICMDICMNEDANFVDNRMQTFAIIFCAKMRRQEYWDKRFC